MKLIPSMPPLILLYKYSNPICFFIQNIHTYVHYHLLFLQKSLPLYIKYTRLRKQNIMKAFKVFLVLAMLMALAITLSATPDQEESFLVKENNDTDDATESMQSEKTASLTGRSRFLASRAAVPTCDKYPRVCRATGSAGRDCCKKKCVDTNTDRVNCGMCGKKCKYGETCCKGKCVNPRSDKKNCGSCNNKCKKGSSCVYGLCSYA